MNIETKKYIAEHLNDDIYKLALNKNNNKLIDNQLAISQIAGKQKVKNKIPSFFHRDDILYPAQLSLEQSSSELTAIYKSSLCNGKLLVDLSGGFGIDCCFMSENFESTVYVEKNKELCEIAAHNFKMLNKKISVLNSSAEETLPTLEHADWIYVDPARRSEGGNKVVLLDQCEPNVSQLSFILLEKAANVMIKLSPMIDVYSLLQELNKTKEIHVVSIDNECKEVVVIMNKDSEQTPVIKTINLRKEKENQLFDFDLNDEKNAVMKIATVIEKYLYEPNAPILKSGAFKLIAERFDLKKLQQHTHLYTSNELKKNFPGRIFEVTKVWNNIKEELKTVKKANISTRNYPINAEQLRKKWKVENGGDIYLFACTQHDSKKIIIECKKAII